MYTIIWFVIYWITKIIFYKKSCINIKNIDQERFKWAMKSAWYIVKIHLERISEYKNIDLEIDEVIKNIPFSTEWTNTDKFENRSNISLLLD